MLFFFFGFQFDRRIEHNTQPFGMVVSMRICNDTNFKSCWRAHRCMNIIIKKKKKIVCVMVSKRATIVCADWDVLTWQCSEPNWDWICYFVQKPINFKKDSAAKAARCLCLLFFVAACCCCCCFFFRALWFVVGSLLSDLLCAQCVCMYCHACVFVLVSFTRSFVLSLFLTRFVLPLPRFVQMRSSVRWITLFFLVGCCVWEKNCVSEKRKKKE